MPKSKPRPLKKGRLEHYVAKRDFDRTPEPQRSDPTATGDMFVVQKHNATQLHYDFRLEIGGVLKSWAVSKGPSLDPRVKRLAVHVEDHPISYGGFEGTIPAGQYGAGEVIVWDTGTWAPMVDVEQGLAKGDLKIRLVGEKLRGGWALVRIKGDEKNWLLIKERDTYSVPEDDWIITETAPLSVISGVAIEALAAPSPPRRKRRAPPKPIAKNIPGARKAKLGDVPKPQLATLDDTPPVGAKWIHEIKFDGYRTLARIENGAVSLFTRNGHDWTERYQLIADALTQAKCKSAIVDGEVCVQLANGATNFAALQHALGEGAQEKLVFFAFDLLHLDGHDLTRSPQLDRKRALDGLIAALIDDTSPVQYSEHHSGSGADLFAQAARLGLEGIVSKNTKAAYAPGRSRNWLKTKCVAAENFAIVGYIPSTAAGGLGSLLLADSSTDGLTYAGKVGTGFSGTVAKELLTKLERLARDEPVFTLQIEQPPKNTVWVEPKLIAEVQYANRTPKGHLRAPSYKGLRPDKSVGAAITPPNKARPPRLVTDTDLANIWITNPGRAMFAKDGPTKLDLALYYARVGDWMLPQIVARPVTLVRCTTGKTKDCFYQRHFSQGMPHDVHSVDLREEGGKDRAEFLFIKDAKGLLSLSQFGVIEFHPWGCKADRPERPDRMVLDLDPDESLDWRDVRAAAVEVRDFLDDLGLASFVRTTGGKGLHVVTALERRTTWKGLKVFGKGLVDTMARQMPGRYTSNPTKPPRRGRIYLDYLRNTRGATAVGSYSIRARPGVPVATPLTWDELAQVDDPTEFNVSTVPARLDGLAADPWADLEASARRISHAMEVAVGVKRES